MRRPAGDRPKILVLSQGYSDVTTDDVLDWLEHLGASWVRLNGEDLDGPAKLRLAISTDGEDDADCRLHYSGLTLEPAGVEAVWFRGWLREWRHEATQLVSDLSPFGGRLQYDIRLHLTREGRKLSDFLFACLDGKRWLGHPRTASPNKLEVLHLATRAGLPIPHTLVTTERQALEGFAELHPAVVAKPIAETILLTAGGASHMLYTSVVSPELIRQLPEHFVPTLFQERLAKEYELRVFYLDGECHAMAIFSQQDPQTAVDFRRYNRQRPNRNVPYRLSEETDRRIRTLMEELGLDTGSLDLVRTPEGRDVFLEVNPVGQFGMVSRPCNYRLERKLAEHLLRRANDG